MYKIKLENTLTHQQYQYQCEDLNNGEKLYFKFNINTLDLEDGEYLLTLLDKRDKVVAEDVLKIGDFNPSTLQYKSGDNTYIAISFDTKLGAKNAVITSIESAVYPDDGYDGMTSVTINAQGVYDSGYDAGNLEGYNSGYTNGKDDGLAEGYTNGYNEGKTDGIAEGTANAKAIIVETAQVLDITENGTYTNTDKLIKEVNVNVVPKINVQQAGLKLGQSTFTEVPEWVDWSGITDMSYMFYNCRTLTTIPQIDTSNVTNMSDMFGFCSKLTTIPEINTSNVTDMGYMFYNCDNLKSLPLLNCSNLIIIEYFLGFSSIPILTDLGGFKNLKINWTDSYGLKQLPNLTYQSCINILNGLYDFTGNGETPTSSQGKLKVHSNFLTTVGDEISIGTNKGWTITA